MNSELVRDSSCDTDWFSVPPGFKRINALESLVLETATECQAFARDKMSVKKAFTIHVKYDWREMRGRSKGGRYSGTWLSRENKIVSDFVAPAISIRMFDPSIGERVYREYPTLAPFGDVGDCPVPTNDDRLRVATIHECSHAIQYATAISEEIASLDNASLPHGIHFASIYSRLRRHFGFVNPELPMYHALPAMQKNRVHGIKRMPADVMQYLADPVAYRKQMKLDSQRRLREEKKAQT
mgnify:CR=1 FL=1